MFHQFECISQEDHAKMFVVIFLTDSKKHIVVPQKFISGLSQQSLNNYGRQRSKKFKVFWSKNCDDDLQLFDDEPNFNRNLCATFPPSEDEVCYMAQIKYFFGMYF